jgi:hypothetical protein
MAVAPPAKVVPPRRAGGPVPRPSTWGSARRGRCPRRLNRSPDAGRAKRRGRSPSGPYGPAGDGLLAERSKAPERLWRGARLQIRRPSSPVAGLVGGLAFRAERVRRHMRPKARPHVKAGPPRWRDRNRGEPVVRRRDPVAHAFTRVGYALSATNSPIRLGTGECALMPLERPRA